ncbi:hypothetical protein SCOR_12885 [Sulfidibacter corallicola]|uniref:Rod shape-determining protein MreD n=1 Tax=Sulfidibacter corallicola TaxID=2818388 RepID=A0A8A4TDZ0_SULCO|nr:hypothetical protein [Sulfidibacter corallicola]QTD47777.1 hypothetical protein J3U87_19490 [Sulfidibacter corallicola]
MKWSKFFGGFLLVILLTFAKSKITRYGVPIEFSIFLIFFVIRSTDTVRAILMTFILSLGLDLILQTGQVKGLATMTQMLLVYVIMLLKKHVIPNYEDLFLLGLFALFYVAEYYLRLGLGKLLNTYISTISPTILVFHALFHTAIFGLLLVINLRFSRGDS